jgi:hypothetical protein
MSTNNILLETIFEDQLQKTMTLGQAIQLLGDMNLIQVGELAELAISKKSGVDRCERNFPNIDLVSGVQIKHAQTNPEHRFRDKNTVRAHVAIKGITAPILAVVTERITNKQYFFYFPYYTFSMYSGHSFSIGFDREGNPNNGWPWGHQVESFDELSELAKNIQK